MSCWQANPIEVIKTRMQAFGGLTGFQHKYSGPISALTELWRDEGSAGFTRGLATSTMRGLLGPGSQIVAYNEFKSAAVARGSDGAAVSTHVACALLSAVVSVACVNPVDVTRTRLYNAPPGRYAGGVEAAMALSRIEGPLAFYKGAVTHFIRLGPHSRPPRSSDPHLSPRAKPSSLYCPSLPLTATLCVAVRGSQ